MARPPPTRAHRSIRPALLLTATVLAGCYVDYDVGRDPVDSETTETTGDETDTGDTSAEARENPDERAQPKPSRARARSSHRTGAPPARPVR